MSDSRSPNRLSLLCWFRLSRVYNQNIRETNQHLLRWKMTATQFDMLAQIGAHEPISQQKLAEKLFVTKGNVAQQIRKLEDLGWIVRTSIGKTKSITLTAQGKSLFQDVVPKQETFQEEQFANLTRDEQKQLVRLLKKIQS
ncbi:MarR family winged helix-turn-helix transcriptional regulator [Aureibacillus halotolerans]|uniref:MarR family transcriptional regulator n=1 Tax=Aureibacillus halotolerans TaxID=1508390 RepID=A0A4R6TW22_9BACI|nr:MarR family transcriptional regulator [Aureibacillus halotolerans]TDQ37436.1 MarR family transcriptional regulator [Aureibacillus halotolerans]